MENSNTLIEQPPKPSKYVDLFQKVATIEKMCRDLINPKAIKIMELIQKHDYDYIHHDKRLYNDARGITQTDIMIMLRTEEQTTINDKVSKLLDAGVIISTRSGKFKYLTLNEDKIKHINNAISIVSSTISDSQYIKLKGLLSAA